MEPHFIVHCPGDTVGVVVKEDIKAGTALSGWIMDNDQTIEITVKEDIPLGHKLAVAPIEKGDTIIKYEHDIGQAVKDIAKGGYVHTHNIKTKRW